MTRLFDRVTSTLMVFLAVGVIAAVPAVCEDKVPAQTDPPKAVTPARPMIAPGDVLAIDVFGEKDLTGQYSVNETGAVIFPMLGEAKAQGLTIENFRLSLTQSLKKFIKNPLVRVDQVVDPKLAGSPGAGVDARGVPVATQTAIILGQIRNQGVQTLNSDGATLLQVIALAGGFTPAADARSVKVVTLREGKRSSKVYNVYDVLEGRTPDPDLAPGDTIYVPESFL